MLGTCIKDPGAKLDYKFDWGRNLQTNESIASFEIDAPGLTKSDESKTTKTVTVFLAGGVAGTSYNVTCRITTDNVVPRIDERTIQIQVQNL